MGGGSDSGRGAMVNIGEPVAYSASYNGPEHIRQNGSEETVATTDTTRSTDTHESDNSRRGGRGKSGGRRARSLSPPHVPKGLKNVGNTCYANAALQCLMSTALTHALLDPSQAVIFRRYASNPNILAAGSGSVDSDLDDDYEFESEIGLGIENFGVLDPNAATPPSSPDEAEKEKRIERRLQRKEARRKAKEIQEMKETCRWLTGQLTDITREYTLHDTTQTEQQPAQTGLVTGFFGLFSGSSLSSNKVEDTVVDPGTITRNVDKLCRTLRPYQQEDSHEFLRALLSTLTMAGQNRQLSSLFDGLLESAVTCKTCRYSSLTRDRYMDLSLDIADSSVTDLEGALHHFTKTETLDSSNMVECTKCREKRIVTKGLRLATAPTILVCHLKRFSCDNYGRSFRLSKDVAFPRRLELDGYMSRANRSTPPPYELVGVLVHAGQSCDSGHYYAFVKSGCRWYKCNDAVVTEVNITTVLQQKAYILVYEVEGMRKKHGCESYGKYHSTNPPHSKVSSSKIEKSPLASRTKITKSKKDKSKTPKKKKVYVRSQSAPRPLREPSPMPGQRQVAIDGSSSRSQTRGKTRESLPGDCFSSTMSLFNLFDVCAAAGDSLCGGSSSEVKSKIRDLDDDDDLGKADDGLNSATDRRRAFHTSSERELTLGAASLSWDPSRDESDSNGNYCSSEVGTNKRGYRQMPPLPSSKYNSAKSSRRASQVDLVPDEMDGMDELDKTWHVSTRKMPTSCASNGNGTSAMKKSISSTNLNAAELQAKQAYRRRRRETEMKQEGPDHGADSDGSTSESDLDDDEASRTRSNSAPEPTHNKAQSIASPHTIRKRCGARLPPLPN